MCVYSSSFFLCVCSVSFCFFDSGVIQCFFFFLFLSLFSLICFPFFFPRDKLKREKERSSSHVCSRSFCSGRGIIPRFSSFFFSLISFFFFVQPFSFPENQMNCLVRRHVMGTSITDRLIPNSTLEKKKEKHVAMIV